MDKNDTSVKTNVLKFTIKWLRKNYEHAEGVCIPRGVVYDAYSDYCLTSAITPSSAATFGKIIRQVFPLVKTRRLGTRGNSKYHYYGLGIKQCSDYFEQRYSRNLDEVKCEFITEHCHPKSKISEIPQICLNMDDRKFLDCPQERNFFIMYQTHLNQIIQYVFQGEFAEIVNFMHSIWTGLPSHLSSLYNKPWVLDTILDMDRLMLLTIFQQVLPSLDTSLPLEYCNEFVKFVYSLPNWMKESVSQNLCNSFCSLDYRKFKCGTMFKQAALTWFRASLIYQKSIKFITTTEILSQLLSDLEQLDMFGIILEISEEFKFPENVHMDLYNYFVTCIEDFENMVEEGIELCSLLNWVDSVGLQFVAMSKVYPDNFAKFQSTSTCIVWSRLFAAILCEVTVNHMSSLSHLHIILTWISELLYCREVYVVLGGNSLTEVDMFSNDV